VGWPPLLGRSNPRRDARRAVRKHRIRGMTPVALATAPAAPRPLSPVGLPPLARPVVAAIHRQRSARRRFARRCTASTLVANMSESMVPAGVRSRPVASLCSTLLRVAAPQGCGAAWRDAWLSGARASGGRHGAKPGLEAALSGICSIREGEQRQVLDRQRLTLLAVRKGQCPTWPRSWATGARRMRSPATPAGIRSPSPCYGRCAWGSPATEPASMLLFSPAA